MEITIFNDNNQYIFLILIVSNHAVNRQMTVIPKYGKISFRISRSFSPINLYTDLCHRNNAAKDILMYAVTIQNNPKGYKQNTERNCNDPVKMVIFI